MELSYTPIRISRYESTKCLAAVRILEPNSKAKWRYVIYE